MTMTREQLKLALISVLEASGSDNGIGNGYIRSNDDGTITIDVTVDGDVFATAALTALEAAGVRLVDEHVLDEAVLQLRTFRDYAESDTESEMARAAEASAEALERASIAAIDAGQEG